MIKIIKTITNTLVRWVNVQDKPAWLSSLPTLEGIIKGAGDGTFSAITSLPAADITAAIANFNNNLSAADNTVQKALDTLDELVTSAGYNQDLNSYDNVVFSTIMASAGDIILPSLTASTYANDDNNPNKANDSDLTTKWTTKNATTGWLKTDLGVGSTNVVTKYKITAPVSGQATMASKDWTFEGSNNDSDWDVLDTVTNEINWGAIEERLFTTSNTTIYRYYRLNISANNGHATYLSIVEFDLYAQVSTIGSVLSNESLDFSALPEGSVIAKEQLKMEITDDHFGSASLILQNRSGLNGARFSTKGSSVDVVDFNFETNSQNATIRYESRAAYAKIAANEFQFGETDSPNFVVSEFGNIGIPKDNIMFLFGASLDASIIYDGTNLLINPKVAGSGILDVLGVVQTDGYNSADGSAGWTGTFTNGDGATVTVKNGLITGVV